MMALSFIHDSAPKGLRGVDLASRQLHAGIMRESLQEALNAESGKIKNQNNNNINNSSVLQNFSGLLNSTHLFPGSLVNPLALMNPSSPSLFSNQLFGYTPPHTAKKRAPAKSQPVVSSTNQINENNNNNRSTGKIKDEVGEEIVSAPLSPPTSGSSPQSNGSNGSAEVGSSVGRPASSLDSRDKVFTCGICNRSFGYKHVLQNHERTHTGEKPFECPECLKRFTRDHHLKTHMRLHTGEKPYRCEHCDRNFVQVANLRRHLRVHTGERPYACEHCESRFSDSNQLKAHMLIHKGEKPFQCQFCCGKFRRRHHLMHHKCPRSNDTNFVLGKTEIDEEMLDFEKDEEDRLISCNNNSVSLESKKIRERKSRDIRRVIRFPPSPPVAPLMTLVLPEQTEPEDLSIRGAGRSLNQNSNSNSSLGDSPRSATPPTDEDMELEADRLEYFHPKFRRHFLTTSHTS